MEDEPASTYELKIKRSPLFKNLLEIYFEWMVLIEPPSIVILDKNEMRTSD